MKSSDYPNQVLSMTFKMYKKMVKYKEKKVISNNITYSYRGHRYQKKVTASVVKKLDIKQNCSISLLFQLNFCFHNELRRVN